MRSSRFVPVGPTSRSWQERNKNTQEVRLLQYVYVYVWLHRRSLFQHVVFSA